MKNLKVSSKLLAGFGIAVAFTLTLGLASMNEMGRLNKGYAEAVNEFTAANAEKAAEFNFDTLNKAGETGNALYKHSLSVTAAMILVCVGFSAFLCFYISGLISKPLHAAVNMITEMGKGHLSNRLRLNRKDEIGAMADTMDKFAEDLQVMFIGTLDKISDGELTMELPCVDDEDELGAALKRIVHPLRDLIIDDGGRVLQAAARKDLSLRLTGEYKGDFAKMKININAVMENLDDALTHVAAAAGRVSGASVEIAADSRDLAECSSEQAGAIKEVSSSLEEISLKTKGNARKTHTAKVLASETRAAAVEGEAVVKRMVSAVNKMKLSSENTGKIVKAINDIAYETSLISLNASVEAARAGEAGRGFAAVTGEMRNLAKRSAEAVKNTAAIMGDSALNADISVKMAEEAAISLEKIIARAEKTGGLIAEIADASSEQAHGIELVNSFLAHMNRVNHNIAADTDESAAASAELNSQAAELAGLVGDFKLSGDAERWYADRSAAEVWVELAPEAREVSVPSEAETRAEPVEAVAVEIYEEPAVSVSPAAVSAHKRRQRRRKRMAAYSAEKTYKHRRRIRAAARHIVNHIVRTDWRKHHPLIRSLRAARAREVFQHIGNILSANAAAV